MKLKLIRLINLNLHVIDLSTGTFHSLISLRLVVVTWRNKISFDSFAAQRRESNLASVSSHRQVVQSMLPDLRCYYLLPTFTAHKAQLKYWILTSNYSPDEIRISHSTR